MNPYDYKQTEDDRYIFKIDWKFIGFLLLFIFLLLPLQIIFAPFMIIAYFTLGDGADIWGR